MAAQSIFDVQALTPYFQDAFTSFDANVWTKSTGVTPCVGTWDSSYVLTGADGLTLGLTQSGNAANSRGAQIVSTNLYNFGVYQFSFRPSSTSPTLTGVGSARSGSVCGGFSYLDPNTTRIDSLQVEGPATCRANTAVATDGVQSGVRDHFVRRLDSRIVTASFWWTTDAIKFYLDGLHTWTLTANVPQEPAYIILNHCPTDNAAFGGLATLNTTRYMHVIAVKHWRQEDLE